MPYTLWSHGRLLGETELEYARYSPLNRGGGLWPTIVGAKLMPIATGVTAASMVLATKTHDLTRPDGSNPEDGPEFEAAMRELTEYADYVEAIDRLNALDLELRDPDGNVVPTEWLDIRDTEFLSDLQRRELEAEWEESMLPENYDPQLEADIQHDLIALGLEPDPMSDEPFEPRESPDDSTFARRPFPLYQILVRLLEESAIP